jgi:hypothetical protein
MNGVSESKLPQCRGIPERSARMSSGGEGVRVDREALEEGERKIGPEQVQLLEREDKGHLAPGERVTLEYRNHACSVPLLVLVPVVVPGFQLQRERQGLCARQPCLDKRDGDIGAIDFQDLPELRGARRDAAPAAADATKQERRCIYVGPTNRIPGIRDAMREYFSCNLGG